MDLRQGKKPVQSRGKWVFPTVMLLLGASVTGCGQDSGYQESLIDVADNLQGTFSLPRGTGVGAPIPLWDTVLIVCPYSDTSLIPERFANEVQNLDTTSTDSVQWLLFSEQNNVSRISIERTAVDFCQGESHPIEYESNQSWNAEKRDGTWSMTPVTD
ncbi:hypothetical protein SAMN04489740_4036 [Arthrobacter alpinus]|uniref:Lipoprotein n=1 Tax=Arthrobacter alpinus TaxID=656366 RepID=A0A1H5PCU3_9MICC|nr:hypothetical protein [Arthrobacter alpinus]SEF10817.1 hypothetical protein SAMN04489740_4036 [Arthrobacter alpinus]